MDRTTAIERLAARLADAGARADWTLLELAARELGPALQALAARGAWNARERGALGALRAAHDGAARQGAAAAARLQAQLGEMRANKEGWTAYALAGELDTNDMPR